MININADYINFDNTPTTPDYSKIFSSLFNNIVDFEANTLNYHQPAINTKVKIEEARISLSNSLNVAPSSIFFTPNGTYANNLSVNSLPQNTSCLITSHFEHPSVILPLKARSKQLNIPLYFIKTDFDSGVNLEFLKNILEQNPHSFVSLSHVNRLTGRLLPFTRVSKICQKFSSTFHSDMSHSFAKFNIDLQKLNADIVTVSGHTFGAPRGVGMIYSKPEINLKPIVLGENNESSVVPGAENINAIVSFVKVFNFLLEKNLFYKSEVFELKNYLKERLDILEIMYNSSGFSYQHFSPYILNIELPKVIDFNNFLIKLDLNNVAIADGRCTISNMFKNITVSFNLTNNKQQIQ
ncbi:MAG: aminotransferase class V-fold PLP-dependent enzyme [Bacteroidales bacterium]|nr:aminotransferase class V-fold PLP-dependent enzyme [Bacteroidales bacterium]